ncbi:carboxy-S-adenosyl-L-methionine synthase CmoA [Synechococcus sp. Cruz-9H2]|uniref:carboxy-S-adenosyl-L-methionine synthase CmoA n=1 Tax=unclassified Synechococcus TaxID=2626047 RepID=UPI0020CE459D|nr:MULTISPECIES: carboxy-S-adenosyl-L-methionine synthase CmoA [unclassified Synechococcus]MCP9820363.1 carboxy-S-adenosyl-L-methionine synthase CmoA [Synechococcus sp. Cruz-9H2]MCP9844671.1 carboxy-S-adenosyl-L-methionine synthase CmoA [Synechococcus sp. Edmonson 11F2]MCP9856793.1 carboxy-S-adenosyl-L-methionine synthase CmoA [Synechococcus sp. Cruz-9C9]MCP9863997.1 carboxy-S-adenosyl-L-methionine synthase CmoA [Synechococcus sp. Cruz-7E5]MCP9871192.1 carboxy-S-adenosyl-L-methionine synthase 
MDRPQNEEQITLRDRLFAQTTSRTSDFEFTEAVAEVFDEMVERSVPLYPEQQSMVMELCSKFYPKDSSIYDLGCSTGTTLAHLATRLPPTAKLIGYDSSAPMLDQARLKLEQLGHSTRIELRTCDLNDDPSSLDLENAGVALLCWTLQFVRPLNRDLLINQIYQSLRPGGVLIVTEKILTINSHMNRFFVDLYHDFKRRNQYSDTEIMRKREALENVLVPYRLDENYELFRRNGFQHVETFFQWYNFAGFLCIKSM